MNTQELNQRLTPGSGTVILSQDVLGKPFGDFLTAYHDAAPIIITQASSRTAEDGVVVISGRSSFANVADLPVMARFSADAAGEVHAELRYQLRDATPESAAWSFSHSFPKLPEVYDYGARQSQPFLDPLELFDTYFIVATHPGQDSALGVPLRAGINFVSHLRPQGLLGLFEGAAASNPTLTLHGIIQPERIGDHAVALGPEEHPWERLEEEAATPLPAGIYLQASLDLGFSVGQLALKDTLLRFYSPLSTDWMEQNPTFLPVQGYTARLSIPSAGIEVDLGCDMQRGVAQVLLYGDCEGVSLGKLTHLMDFTGTGGLLEQLPDELRKPVDALEKLSLMRVALDLVLEEGVLMVRTAFVTVGFPNLAWKVWEDDLVVESLACQFVIFDPFRTASLLPADPDAVERPLFRNRIGVVVTGVVEIEGVGLLVSASSDEAFAVRARTLGPVALPFDKLLKSHAPALPAPTPLTINSLDVLIAPGQRYTMDMLLAGTPSPWRLAVGKEPLTISDVTFFLDRPATGQTMGRFAGRIDLGGAELQVVYNVPGTLFLRSVLPRTTLSRLISDLCNQTVKLPSGFDLTLPRSSVVIQEQQGKLLFQLMTEVEGLGALAFEARNTSGTSWGFAFGIDLSASQPSKVPGLAALATLEKMLHLQRFMLVVSSIDQPGFQLPDSAQFNSPRLATKKVALPKRSNGVSAGVNVFAEWALDTGGGVQKILQKLLGLNPTLDVMIQVSDKSARLFTAISSKVQGQPLHGEFGVALGLGAGADSDFFLTGTMPVKIQGQLQTFDITMVAVPNGLFLSGNMRGNGAVKFGHLQLSDLALEIGVNGEGLPSLGIAGTLAVGKFHSSLAMFFDSAEPGRSLLAGAVSDLTLRDVVGAMLGGGISSPIDHVLDKVAIRGTHRFEVPASLGDSLDALRLDGIAEAFQSKGKIKIPSDVSQVHVVVLEKGKRWNLTDLTTMRHYQLEKKGDVLAASIEAQFYFAPEPTSIGSARFPAGFYINGALEFLGYKAEATIDINASRGVSVDVQMDKLVLMREEVFSIAAADGKGGPKLSISTYNPPHFNLDGGMTFLGLKRSVKANVSTHGVEFDLRGKLVPGVDFDIDVRFGKSGLSASGRVEVGIGTIDLGALGKVKINTSVDVDVTVDIVTERARSVNVGHGTWKPGDTVAKNEIGELVFQQDGNLVWYDITGEDGRFVWGTGTVARLEFQDNGNLVVYDSANHEMWKSNTQGKGANRLTVQEDGNVCLYDSANHCVWQTATHIDRPVKEVSVGHGSWTRGSTLAKNELGELVFQEDGNLVWYDTTSGSGRFVWGTGTVSRPAARLEFQGDGNLVIYDSDNHALWNSNTQGKGTNRLSVQEDGNVCLYDSANRCVWQTGTHIHGGTPGASIELDTDLVFAGQKIDIPRFRIEAHGDTFTKLASHVEKKIEEAFKELYKDATKWANAVADGVLDGVEDTEKVFKDVYKKSEKEAKQLANETKKGFNKSVHAVEGAAKSTGKAISKAFKKIHF